MTVDRYAVPATVGEAVELLSRYGKGARLIAGGTDLLLEMQRGDHRGVDTLIDITRIPGLDTIRAENGVVYIGAGATHAQAVSSPLIVGNGLPLAQACLEVGSPQLRNRATIAGNVVTASPANDSISALLALDAAITLISERGMRTVRLADFYTGVRTTVMERDELAVGLSFPMSSSATRGVFVKLGLRRAQAISLVHIACVLEIVDGAVVSARIALGSVAPVVMLAERASGALIGNELSESTIAAAAQAAMEACSPIDDIRAPAEYRTRMTGLMVRRALKAVLNGTEAQQWPAKPVVLAVPVSVGAAANHAPLYRQDTRVHATINSTPIEALAGISKTLLDWLRDDAGPAAGVSLTGTKEGCAEGECGACTVHLDGAAVLACLVPAPRADGSVITTVEGIVGDDGTLHPLQQAFVDHSAVQCGYCTPGFVMAGVKLLEERAEPSPEDILAGLSGCLCRCTGYYKIIDAVGAAALSGQGAL